MRRLNSLRAKMTAVVVMCFAAWMALVSLGAMVYFYSTTHREAERLLTAAVTEIRREWLADASAPKQDRQPDALTMYCSEHREELAADHLAVLLVDSQGSVTRSFQRKSPPWPDTRDDDWMTSTAPLGTDTLVVGLDWGRAENELRERAVLLVAVSLCGTLAAAFATWMLVGGTLSPIHHLSRQAVAASAEGLHVQLVSPSPDAELVELVGTLNGLLSRIGQIASSKGRFYAAASHELRTPLQALSGHLEVALSRPRNADEYRLALDEALTQARRLIALVRDLLLLNQLDAAPPPPSEERVSLAELCDRAVLQVGPIIAERQLRVSTQLEQDGEVAVPMLHAEMLLRNVIENAVKYAAPGGEVGISLDESPSAVRIRIHNTCPPIPDWDDQALFEPFLRLDASRNQKTGGNGLGLAICRAIAVANGWTIRLSQDETGVLAEVTIPLTSA